MRRGFCPVLARAVGCHGDVLRLCETSVDYPSVAPQCVSSCINWRDQRQVQPSLPHEFGWRGDPAQVTIDHVAAE